MQRTTNKQTEKLVTVSVLIALIAVLQAFSSVAARIGLFSFALGLFPATIGSVMYGKRESLLFGAVLGAVILATDATAWALFSVNFIGTVLVVMLKSMASTLVVSVIFGLLSKTNRTLAAVLGAVCAPIVNTVIFVTGVCIFFEDFFKPAVADAVPFFVGLILILLVNFIIEMIINVVLSPVVLRVVDMKKKR